MSTRGAAALLAGLVLVVGVALGFVGVTADTQYGPVACGSAFMPDRSAPDASAPDLVQETYVTMRSACDSRIGSQREISLPIVGVGVLTLLFCGLTIRSSAPQSSSESSVGRTS